MVHSQRLQAPLDMHQQQQFTVIQPQYIFQTKPQLPTVVSTTNAAAVSLPPAGHGLLPTATSRLPLHQRPGRLSPLVGAYTSSSRTLGSGAWLPQQLHHRPGPTTKKGELLMELWICLQIKLIDVLRPTWTFSWSINSIRVTNCVVNLVLLIRMIHFSSVLFRMYA
jgi:hypothetical protein